MKNCRNLCRLGAITWLLSASWGWTQSSIPAVIFNISADTTEYILVVDKQQQKLLVVQSPKPQDLQIVGEFRITTGKEPGDKMREGDHRTPEGIYYVIDKVPTAQLSPKYGPAAYVLDYPNFVDRLEGRNGSNIWIHGRDEAIRDRITEGCVSLENSHILQLANFIKIPKTPVIICEDLSRQFKSDKNNYLAQQTQWQDYLSGWANAWKEGALDKYVDYYAANFRDEGGRNRAQFKAYKANLEKRYEWKDVRLEKISVLTSKQETHVRFIQKYQSPFFYSEGWKKLILIPTGNHWKIISEKFSPTRPRQNTAEFVEKFIQQWLQAWRSRDLNAYLDCYAPDFHSDGYDRSGWRKYKAELFAALNQIDVQYDNLEVQTTQPLTYQVTFRQIYRANGYRDVGIKTIILKGPADRLQIIQEEWKKIE